MKAKKKNDEFGDNLLIGPALVGTLYKGQEINKGMLVVGTSNYLRELIPSLTKDYDFHLCFYPQNQTKYKIALLGIDRKVDKEDRLIYSVVAEAQSVQEAITLAVGILTKYPVQFQVKNKRALWINHAAYRMSKISLKEVLHLEPHKDKEEVK